jgi:hypothetical protein
MDPITAQCPDYSLDIYQAVRAPFVNPQTTDEQAAALLTTVWVAQNTVEKQQWQEQIDQDEAEEDVRRAEAEEEARLRQEESDKEKEEQRKEELKKNKSKYIPIPARGVPTQPPIIVSIMATRRLGKGDYVPLWYYTNAGIDDASKSFSIIDEESLSLIKREDGSTSLVPTASSKETKTIVEDQDLTWDDFSIAAPRMIDALSLAEWPEDRIRMMVRFWANLTTHHFRSSRNQLDRDALLLYQAEQRRLWHQAINSPGHGYDLSEINEELLRQTKERLYWIDRARKDREREHTLSSRPVIAAAEPRRGNQPSSNRNHNTRHRSASPRNRRPRSADYPGARTRRPDDRRDQDFSYGTNGRAYPVCAVCLGRHSHNVFSCDALKTWDGAHSTITKRIKGTLYLRSNSAPMCIEWQRSRGCDSAKHDEKHLCSGCSQRSHGAQTCPRSQKT